MMKVMMMIESRRRNSDQVDRKLREYEDIISVDNYGANHVDWRKLFMSWRCESVSRI